MSNQHTPGPWVYHAKTASIQPYPGSGTTRSQRAWDLIRRYDDLKDAVAGERGYTPAWIAYCDSINACRSHTGIDLYSI